MRVTRFASAPAYAPPLHTGVDCKRLQGHEAGPTQRFWVGHSTYHPGGRASEAPTMEETIYTVLEGEIVVRSDGEETTLKALDSAHFAKGVVRSVENCSNRDATVLVTIAIPQAS